MLSGHAAAAPKQPIRNQHGFRLRKHQRWPLGMQKNNAAGLANVLARWKLRQIINNNHFGRTIVTTWFRSVDRTSFAGNDWKKMAGTAVIDDSWPKAFSRF